VAFAQQAQQGGGGGIGGTSGGIGGGFGGGIGGGFGGGRGGIGRGMHSLSAGGLGAPGRGGGMYLPSDLSDTETSRYVRAPSMQIPDSQMAGSRGGGGGDMMRTMMGFGGSRGDGFGEYGGSDGVLTDATSFGRHPPSALGMESGMEREAGGMWPPEQRLTAGHDSVTVGGPVAKDMFARDREVDRSAAAAAEGDHLLFADHLRTEQLPPPTQKQQMPRMETSADPKPRVVRFTDEGPAKQPKMPSVSCLDVHDPDRDAKMCSVCQHSETGIPSYWATTY